MQHIGVCADTLWARYAGRMSLIDMTPRGERDLPQGDVIA
jgi:hypothetical protein